MKKRDIRTFFTVIPVTKRSREESRLVGNKNRAGGTCPVGQAKAGPLFRDQVIKFITLGSWRVRTAAAQSTKVSSGRSQT